MKHHVPVSETLDIFLRAERASPGTGSGLRMRSPQRPRLSPYPSRSALPVSLCIVPPLPFIHGCCQTERAVFRQKIWLRPDILLYLVKSKTAFPFLDFPTPAVNTVYVLYIMWPYWHPFAHFTPYLCY